MGNGHPLAGIISPNPLAGLALCSSSLPCWPPASFLIPDFKLDSSITDYPASPGVSFPNYLCRGGFAMVNFADQVTVRLTIIS
jgi:hypothetical protein